MAEEELGQCRSKAPSTMTEWSVLVLMLLLVLMGDVQAQQDDADGDGEGDGVSLLCRTDEVLRVRWSGVGAAPFRLQVQRRGQPEWTPLASAAPDNASTATVAGLEADTEYRVRVIAASSEGDEEEESAWLRTLPPNYVPGKVTDLAVTQRRGNNASVDAVVSWTPAPDMTCLYEVALWSTASMRVHVKQLNVTDAHEVTFRSLNYSTKYEVLVNSKSTNHSLESKATLDFEVSHCFDWYNDTASCPPPAPVRLVADVRRRHKSVDVSWEVVKGRPLPSTFLVTVYSPRWKEVGFRELPGTARSTTFQDVDVTNETVVTVQALAAGGSNANSAWARDVEDDDWLLWLLLHAFLPALLLGALGAAALLVLRRRKRSRTLKLDDRDEPPPEADEWEIAPERLQLGRVLGEGAFGVVQRGLLLDVGDVAVKMLREDATPEDARQFLREMEMMKQVGPHPHVVSIVGCVTRDSRLRLVVEFCALGDLHNYLHKALEASQHLAKGELITTKSLVVNHMYDLQQAGAVCLQAADLLSFARQIAMGMEFLAINHVLHRDLAARNVLVCDPRRVKISDFGLSRDVYEQNVYCTSGHGRLPVKWMALESLMHNVYTSQSDVWSFGVLLWEIVTLGANPYPSTPTGRVLKLLRTGYRMECPGNCSPQLYQIMRSCWEVKPRDRPTFSQLRQKLDELLEGSCPQQYLDLNVALDVYTNGDDNPRYLRPLDAN